jgi:shikimate dehydrogenase
VIAPRRLVLLGHPVSHSLSPAIQNAALRAAGLHVRYEAIDVTAHDLRAELSRLASQEAGGNITVPHKMLASECMGAHTSQALEVGAINTFGPDGSGQLVGHNTDVEGFDALARSVGAGGSGISVSIIGAGGGAAAVLSAIRRWRGARAEVFARNQKRAAALAMRFSDVASVAAAPAGEGVSGDLVVNATPVGLTDESLPIALDTILPHAIVLDLAYRPGETAWVRAARARGHVAADGITMLVEQAAAAFEWWFQMEPDRDEMWQAVRQSLPS